MRGNARASFRVERVEEKNGELSLHDEVTEGQTTPETRWAVPLLVTVPKKRYAAVAFVENGKEAKKLPEPNRPGPSRARGLTAATAP